MERLCIHIHRQYRHYTSRISSSHWRVWGWSNWNSNQNFFSLPMSEHICSFFLPFFFLDFMYTLNNFNIVFFYFFLSNCRFLPVPLERGHFCWKSHRASLSSGEYSLGKLRTLHIFFHFVGIEIFIYIFFFFDLNSKEINWWERNDFCVMKMVWKMHSSPTLIP